MNAIKVDKRSEVIGQFYAMYRDKFTFQHIKLNGIPKSTIYRVCQRVEKGLASERKTGQSRKVSENEELEEKVT